MDRAEGALYGRPAVQQPDRPLPDCLTRLLGAATPHAVEPTPGDRVRGDLRGPKPRSRALEGVVLWALVYNVAGFVWLGILWQTLRWLTR